MVYSRNARCAVLASVALLTFGGTTARAVITIAQDTSVIPGRALAAFAVNTAFNNAGFGTLTNEPMNVGMHVRLTLSASDVFTNPVWSFSGSCAPILDYCIFRCVANDQGFLAACDEVPLTAADQ